MTFPQRGPVHGRWRWPLLALLGLAMLLMAPNGADAHAFITESSPEANAVVPEAPASVEMTFSEPLEWSYSKAELYDQTGNAVANTSVHRGASDYDMVLELPSDLPDGTYSVLWRTLSTADGHTAQNYFAFTVGSEADVVAVTQPTIEDSGPTWQQAVSRWLALLGLAGAVAAWPVWLAVSRPGLARKWHVARPATVAARRFAMAAIALALAGNVVALLVQASALDEGNLLDDIATTVRDTRYGHLWLLRIGLVLVYAYALQWVAWWWPYRRPIRSALAVALAATLPVPYSLIAHASAQTTGHDVAIMNDYLHLLAASLWAGGLALMATVFGAVGYRRVAPDLVSILGRTLPRFSTLALTAWVVMLLSGLYSAWLQVGSWDALRDTDYGTTLLIKLALLVPVLALAAYNLVVVTRRLSRRASLPHTARRLGLTVLAEIALAVVVFLVVGSLTAQAPAREEASAASTGQTVQLSGSDTNATMRVTPGAAGPNRIDITLTDPSPAGTEVLLRVEQSARDTGQQEIPLDPTANGAWAHQGSELSLTGDWDLELIVRPSGGIEQRLHGTVSIQSEHAAHEAGTAGPSWVLTSASAVVGMLAIAGGSLSLFAGWQVARRRTGVAVAAGIAGIVVGVLALMLARTEVVGTATAIIRAFTR